MNLDDVRALVATAETGSLAKAALRLNITQPAVTRRIQRLEADLGALLLDRDLKPARLTRAGEEAYRHALVLLQAARELQAQAAGPEAAGKVRIGVSYAVADAVLALAVQAVQRAHPRSRLALQADRSATLAERVAGHDLDAAVVVSASTRPEGGYAVSDLGRERVVVVTPAGHQAPARTTLAAIAGERWVLNPDGCGFRSQLEAALASQGAPLDIAVEIWGAEVQLSLIARGAGLGLVPARILASNAYRDLVRALDVADFHPELAVHLLAAPAQGAVRTVLDTLERAIRRELQDPSAAAA